MIFILSGHLHAKITFQSGHAGVGVMSLCGSSLSAPSLVTPEFREFFRLGRAIEGYPLPLEKEALFTSLLVYGYQGAEEDAGKTCPY